MSCDGGKHPLRVVEGGDAAAVILEGLGRMPWWWQRLQLRRGPSDSN